MFEFRAPINFAFNEQSRVARRRKNIGRDAYCGSNATIKYETRLFGNVQAKVSGVFQCEQEAPSDCRLEVIVMLSNPSELASTITLGRLDRVITKRDGAYPFQMLIPLEVSYKKLQQVSKEKLRMGILHGESAIHLTLIVGSTHVTYEIGDVSFLCNKYGAKHIPLSALSSEHLLVNVLRGNAKLYRRCKELNIETVGDYISEFKKQANRIISDMTQGFSDYLLANNIYQIFQDALEKKYSAKPIEPKLLPAPLVSSKASVESSNMPHAVSNNTLSSGRVDHHPSVPPTVTSMTYPMSQALINESMRNMFCMLAEVVPDAKRAQFAKSFMNFSNITQFMGYSASTQAHLPVSSASPTVSAQASGARVATHNAEVQKALYENLLTIFMTLGEALPQAKKSEYVTRLVVFWSQVEKMLALTAAEPQLQQQSASFSSSPTASLESDAVTTSSPSSETSLFCSRKRTRQNDGDSEEALSDTSQQSSGKRVCSS